MIRATLTKPDGSILLEVNLPSTAKELPLKNYISFLSEVKKMGVGANPILTMAKAVSELTNTPIEQVLQASLGQTWMEGDEIQGGIKTMYSWAEGVVDKYLGTIQNRVPWRFEYKGGYYFIPPIIVSQLSGAALLPNLETCQAIEAFETIRLFDKESKKSGDEDGSVLFTQHLRLLAILFLKEGEQLPGDDSQREHWIEERAKHFEDIDAQTALDADFFLLNILQPSKETERVIGSLSLQSLGLVMGTQKARKQSQTRTPKRSRIKKRLVSVSDGGRSLPPLKTTGHLRVAKKPHI